jgi:hypothetical protein
LQIGYREGPTFEDRDSRRLESQLNRVFCGIYRQVVRSWREERKHQAFQRELEEEARQRAEAARSQAEREKVIAEERARRQQLSSEANRWAQSIRIRDYVEHIRTSAVGCPITPALVGGHLRRSDRRAPPVIVAGAICLAVVLMY